MSNQIVTTGQKGKQKHGKVTKAKYKLCYFILFVLCCSRQKRGGQRSVTIVCALCLGAVPSPRTSPRHSTSIWPIYQGREEAFSTEGCPQIGTGANKVRMIQRWDWFIPVVRIIVTPNRLLLQPVTKYRVYSIYLSFAAAATEIPYDSQGPCWWLRCEKSLYLLEESS